METQNWFWWDGGFEAIHNRPNFSLNKEGIAHIATPHYRLDISRFRGMPVGLERISEINTYRYGLTLPPVKILFHTSFRIIYNGKILAPKEDINKEYILMVYDSGSICHELHLKNIKLFDSDGILHKEHELELVFYTWADCIAFTAILVESDTRICVETIIEVDFDFENIDILPFNQGAVITKSDNSFVFCNTGNMTCNVNNNKITLCAEGANCTVHILPVINSLTDTFQTYNSFRGNTSISVTTKNEKYFAFLDEMSGAYKITLNPLNTRNQEVYSLEAVNTSRDSVNIRLLFARNGVGRLQRNGEVLPKVEIGSQLQTESFPVVYDNNNIVPLLIQVSCDGHEFDNYSRPYPHIWMHYYTNIFIEQNQTKNLTIDMSFAGLSKQNAAQFRQLSLLGWDDNPIYGNSLDRYAIQMWVQGLINHQEILCICPESHMSDSTITDIRTIDHKFNWGSNNGGGDFLRYSPVGEADYLNKMRAARYHFKNYGPWLGDMVFYMTSEDGCIEGEIKSTIIAGNDISRIYFDCKYRVVKDIRVNSAYIAWLGCPTYDYSCYALYAIGNESGIILEGQCKVENGEEKILINYDLTPNTWFSVYRGGVIDEQYREPNGNKGLIYRNGILNLQAHPNATYRATKTQIANIVNRVNTQFWLGIHTGTTEITLKKGDTFSIVYEYAPTLKFHYNYGPIANPNVTDISYTYLSILKEFPDSCEPVSYEAIHGAIKAFVQKGEIINDIFTSILLNEEDEAVFELEGGSGCVPLRIYLHRIPISHAS